MHSVRIVYDAWVAADAPEPRVVEVDGSTIDARWQPVADVESGAVPTVPMVRDALAHHHTVEHQRLAAYALVRALRRAQDQRSSCSPATPRAGPAPASGRSRAEAWTTASRRSVPSPARLPRRPA